MLCLYIPQAIKRNTHNQLRRQQILSILDEYVDVNNKLIEIAFFDSIHHWRFEKDSLEECNMLTQSDIDEMMPFKGMMHGMTEGDFDFISENKVTM